MPPPRPARAAAAATGRAACCVLALPPTSVPPPRPDRAAAAATGRGAPRVAARRRASRDLARAPQHGEISQLNKYISQVKTTAEIKIH